MKQPKPYINPYVGGMLLGIVLFLAFVTTGAGLGASGAVKQVGVTLVDQVAPGHIDRSAYLARYAGGHRNALADPSVWMLLGTALGGLASGLLARRVRPEVRRGPRVGVPLRIGMALLGGAIMGYGAGMARGCTSGQALTGGAVLSVGSWAFMFAVFGGAYALAYALRRLWI